MDRRFSISATKSQNEEIREKDQATKRSGSTHRSQDPRRLQEDNQISNGGDGGGVGISRRPFARSSASREGISRTTSRGRPFRVGRSLIVFASVTLERQREDLLENFERKMLAHAEVMQCYFISGGADYLVVVSVPDVAAYNDFARRVFANEPNIRMFRSSFALSRVNSNLIPLGDAERNTAARRNRAGRGPAP